MPGSITARTSTVPGLEEYWFSENHYEELVDPVGAIWNSDHLLMEEIVDDLQDQLEADNGPVFSFSVSYQNHGPYESGYTSSEVYLDPGRRLACPRRPATSSIITSTASTSPSPPCPP